MNYGEKLKDPRWQKRRLEILQRDNFCCVKCRDTKTELQVHHKKYFGEPWEADDESLETLCKHCHFIFEELKATLPEASILKYIKIEHPSKEFVSYLLLIEFSGTRVVYLASFISGELYHLGYKKLGELNEIIKCFNTI